MRAVSTMPPEGQNVLSRTRRGRSADPTATSSQDGRTGLLQACFSGHRSMINGNAHWRRLAFRPRTLPSPFTYDRRQRLARCSHTPLPWPVTERDQVCWPRAAGSARNAESECSCGVWVVDPGAQVRSFCPACRGCPRSPRESR